MADESSSSEPSQPPIPALAAKADDLEALRTAVVDAAGVSFGLWVSYLFTLFYLLVAASGVTHRDLFFESPVKLPFLNVDLPLKGFFRFGPAIFLLVHAYVLLHFVMLAGKIRVFDVQLRAQIRDSEVRTKLRGQLPSNIFVQVLAGPREWRDGAVGRLLWLIALVSLVIAPVSLLAFFQLQFLPYQDLWITWWHRVAVVADLVLLWTLWPKVALQKGLFAKKGEARRGSPVAVLQRIGTITWMMLISSISLSLVFVIAILPGEPLERNLASLWLIAPLREVLVAGQVDDVARKPKSWWSNRLVLSGLDAIDHAKLDSEAKIAAVSETVSLRARSLEGAVLIGAKLRKVDFTGARLDHASLDRADLRGARLDKAQLQDAVLDHAKLQGASLFGAQLQRAWLAHAQLQGASLLVAQLEDAVLEGVQLQDAVLTDANLRGASINDAQLQGASLGGAHLEGALLVRTLLYGAWLERAQLQGATLLFARLQGAWLDSAQLQGAHLDYAQLQGALLNNAQLQGASLKGTNLQGAQLDYAQLQGARFNHTDLKGASLEHSFVWRADARNADTKYARIQAVEKGPQQLIGGIGGRLVNWSTDSFSRFKRSIVQEVSTNSYADKHPEYSTFTVVPAPDWVSVERLNPETPVDDEKQLAEEWENLQKLSPTWEAYEAALAELWRQIGCSPEGAPYVLGGLIRIIVTDMPAGMPFAFDSAQGSQLAAYFLNDECAGAHGLSDDAKRALKNFRDGAAHKLANPTAQGLPGVPR